MMDFNHDSEVFNEYLKKVRKPADDKCWLCHKTPEMIREEYFEYMKRPKEEFEDIELDDIVIMTYKTKKPICAACYFELVRNKELVQEVLEKPEDEVW